MHAFVCYVRIDAWKAQENNESLVVIAVLYMLLFVWSSLAPFIAVVVIIRVIIALHLADDLIVIINWTRIGLLFHTLSVHPLLQFYVMTENPTTWTTLSYERRFHFMEPRTDGDDVSAVVVTFVRPRLVGHPFFGIAWLQTP